MPKIFICYRREDTEGFAGRIFDRLKQSFGAGSVFMDIDNIPPGERFAEVAKKAVCGCDACLVLIGKKWLDVVGRQGSRRIDDPEDFLRVEVENALGSGAFVVPVLLQGASMPEKPDLPPSLRQLSEFQAVDIGARFDPDVKRLVDSLNVHFEKNHDPACAPRAAEGDHEECEGSLGGGVSKVAGLDESTVLEPKAQSILHGTGLSKAYAEGLQWVVSKAIQLNADRRGNSRILNARVTAAELRDPDYVLAGTFEAERKAWFLLWIPFNYSGRFRAVATSAKYPKVYDLEFRSRFEFGRWIPVEDEITREAYEEFSKKISRA